MPNEETLCLDCTLFVQPQSPNINMAQRRRYYMKNVPDQQVFKAKISKINNVPTQ